MKRITLVVCALSCAFTVMAQTKTINVENAGTLYEQLTDEDYTTVKELIVIGKVNYEDMPLIRNLCGYDGDGKKVGICEKLDLSKAEVTTLDEEDGSDVKDAIGINELANCHSLKTLILPDNLKKYQARGLAYNENLTSIRISADNQYFTAEGCALYNKSKTALCVLSAAAEGVFVIPSSMTNMYTAAFLGCDKITAYEVENGNTVFSSSNGALIKGEQLYLVPAGVTGFFNIPEGVTDIADYAFNGAKVEGLGIPASLTDIGMYKLNGASSLVEFTVAEGNTHYVAKNGFLLDKNTEKIILLGAPGLSGEITLPEGVTGVNNYACSLCDKIEKLVVPEGVTDIYDFAFGNAKGLKYISLPSTLKTLTHQCFINCRNLLDVYIYAKEIPTVNGSPSFMGGAKGCTLWVPEGCLDKYKNDMTCGFGWFGIAAGNSIKEMTGTGVEGVVTSETDVVETVRFTIDGRKTSFGTRGLNIIRMSDGSTRKTFTK